MPALARDPFTTATWWLLGLALTLAASLTQSPALLGVYCAVAVGAILVFATPETRQSSLRIYGVMAVLVIAMRLVFRIVFNGGFVPGPALPLPTISFQLGTWQQSLLGPVPLASLLQGFTDGLRLAAIILSVAMANSVANPRRLLRLAPTALFEFATAVAVALNLAPQLIASLRRVRRAQNLRGGANGAAGLGGLVIPVLEDAVNRSLELAASMDSRGFGRKGAQTRMVLNANRGAVAVALVLVVTACYLLLTNPQATPVAAVCGLLGIGLIALSLRLTSMHKLRTSLRVETPTLPDYLAIGLAVVFLALLAAAQLDPRLGWWH